MSAQRFSWSNFLVRFIAALILVFATYNSTEFSYYQWAILPLPEITPVKLFIGLLLLIGWVIFIRATLRSLGPIGIMLACALFGALFWMIVDWGLVAADNITAMIYIVQFILCLVLATGMSWSHVRRRLSGQIDADDVDEQD